MFPLTGTANQIEWAERIRIQVNAEFDRVARVLKEAASKQSEPDRLNTHAMIAILEEKCAEVMANTKAGYFIHDWQELRDQVRQMIMKDERYKAIKAGASRSSANAAIRAEPPQELANAAGGDSDA